jgi:RNA polymerase sigma-70 factor (ECF subfamily)
MIATAWEAPLSAPEAAKPADTEALSLADLEGVYRAHWRRLHAIARRIAGPVDADAVIQEVFLALLRDDLRARFVGGDLGAWLSEITRRKSLQHLERRGREQPAEAIERAGASPEEDLAARELVRRFLERQVPEAQRRFFELRFLERRTQVETAALLNMPRSTLEGWEHKLSRALRAFVLEAR